MANTQLTQTGAQVQADLNKIEGLPTPTVADSGKVVGVNSSGQYVLVDAGGGDTPPTTPTDAVIFYSKEKFQIQTYTLQAKFWSGTLYYSTNHSSWTTWDGGNSIIEAVQSDGYYKIYLRGNNTYIGSSSGAKYIQIIGSTNIKCCGNVNTLLSYTSPPTTLTQPYALAYLFYKNYNVDFDVTLPATTLSSRCYYMMFGYCHGLTKAPELPATTLADYCYTYMFFECDHLSEAPSLPATTLADYCYNMMFYNCYGLTTSMRELPATTATKGCYSGMFNGCMSLTSVPIISATTMGEQCCNSMFANCYSLKTVPNLPATTLATNCYSNMFQSCFSLQTVPELPATTLAEYCYSSMFQNCKSLNALPKLPATTLAASCYSSMFQNCSNIKIATAVSDTYNKSYRIPTSGSGSSVSSSLSGMFGSTGGTFKGTPTINTTYYTSNTLIG